MIILTLLLALTLPNTLQVNHKILLNAYVDQQPWRAITYLNPFNIYMYLETHNQNPMLAKTARHYNSFNYW